MPSFADVANALKQYKGRYRYLDAFVDDIDEFRKGAWGEATVSVVETPRPILRVSLPGRPVMKVEIFKERGVARFSHDGVPEAGAAALGAAIGGILGAAIGAASEAKEGLLGGLALGILVGGLIGAGTAGERVLALQFVPDTGSWRLYDGPLLPWAKSRIAPPTSVAP